MDTVSEILSMNQTLGKFHCLSKALLEKIHEIPDSAPTGELHIVATCFFSCCVSKTNQVCQEHPPWWAFSVFPFMELIPLYALKMLCESLISFISDLSLQSPQNIS